MYPFKFDYDNANIINSVVQEIQLKYPKFC